MYDESVKGPAHGSRMKSMHIIRNTCTAGVFTRSTIMIRGLIKG